MSEPEFSLGPPSEVKVYMPRYYDAKRPRLVLRSHVPWPNRVVDAGGRTLCVIPAREERALVATCGEGGLAVWSVEPPPVNAPARSPV